MKLLRTDIPEELPNDIPAWHIPIVQTRLEEYRQKPSEVIDSDTAINDIEKEL